MQIFVHLPSTGDGYLNGHIKTPVLVPGLVDSTEASRANELPVGQALVTNWLSLVAPHCHLLFNSGTTTKTSVMEVVLGGEIKNPENGSVTRWTIVLNTLLCINCLHSFYTVMRTRSSFGQGRMFSMKSIRFSITRKWSRR